MSKELELIAKQQLQIEDLKLMLGHARTNMREIHSSIICVGGPLNDNCLGYTRPQLKLFWDFKELAEEVIELE